ncbi:MAG: hypothetical protein NC114_09960 [Ruminococcus flavefaciens]|nr:hypothetical protein [Ruminococcus flavefaciens]
MELNIMVGVVGAALSVALLVAIWRRFNITASIAKVQEDLANFYTPDILVKNKKKVEDDANAVGSEAAATESDGEGSDENTEGDESGSEGDSE